MPYSEYTYPISATKNNKVDMFRLQQEIVASEQEGYGPFSVVFDHISVDGAPATFAVWFKNELPVGEKTMLDNIVANHSGEPWIKANPVVDTPREGDERVIGTHNFCDPCSWFGDSVRATETLTDSGDHKTFASTHVNWIDMVSGRMHNDNLWVYRQQMENPGDPHGYQVVVKVDGVEKTMREPFEASGGDYGVNWEDGSVTFFAEQTEVVTADFSYATTSGFHLRSLPGKTLVIEDAESDTSVDMVMTDSILYGGWYWNGSEWVLDGAFEFKRAAQISTEARGNYPQFSGVGATDADKTLSLKEFRKKSRGMKFNRQATPFNYATARHVVPGTELRVWTKHDRAFEGEHVTLTFYCTEVDAT